MSLCKVTKYLSIKDTVLYIIDEKSKTPLHIQLYNALKNEIINNYKRGDKLPSIRKVATLYNLSKNTVQSSYNQLYAEGYIESVPKSGYFVSDLYFDSLSKDAKQPTQKDQKKNKYRYDFFPARLSKDSFPLKLWKRLYSKVIDSSLDFGAYHDGQGEEGLREQIALYLKTSRAVECHPQQIIITSGFGESMTLLAKLIRNRYTTLGMESPGYHVARRAFEEYGYEIEKISVGTKGIDLEELKSSKAKILYITPSHQYPTGVTIPIANRLKLIEYINNIQGLIIEDDYDSELRYVSRPIPSLQGLDNYDRVVYMGTFSKSLSPAIRVAYMVLPNHLLKSYHESFDAHFPKVSLMTQKTLEIFMKDGHWDRHIRKIRMINKKKHDILKSSLKRYLKDTMEIVAEGGGLSILINPTVSFDWELFKQKAEDEGIKLYFAKERSGGEFEAIRMGFGGFSEEEIPKAIELFAKVWKEALC